MKKILACSLLLLSSIPLFAQQLPDDPAVRKGKLENGLTYYIVHNELPAQRAEFYLATNVGAIQETPDQDGLAHFLEHMCFNGTKNFPDKGILDYLQSIGASFGGNVNAMTGVEETVYMLTNIPLLRESVIDSCLLILHDYSHFVTCDPTEIDKERGVIIEERRSRRDVSWRMNEQTRPYLYGDTKYAGCDVIGSQENLETFQPSSLTAFYKTWYRPDMQAVIVVGDVDPETVESKIAATWSDVPAAENPQPKAGIVIPSNDEPLIGVATDPEFPGMNISMYWKTPIESEAGNNTLMKAVDDLLEDIVSYAMSERFTTLRAVPETPLNDAVFATQNVCETLDATILVAAGKEGTWAETFEIMMTEAEKLRRYGLTDGEIERAKANIMSAAETAFAKADTRKNPEFVSPLIQNFFDNESYMSPKDEYGFVKTILPQVTSSMINEKIAEMVTDDNLVVMYYGTRKEGLEHPTEQQLRDIINKVKAADIERNVEEDVAADFIDPATLKGSGIRKVKKSIHGATELRLKNGATVVLLPTEYEKDKINFGIFKKGGMSIMATEDMPSYESNVWQIFQMNHGISSFTTSDIQKMLSGKELSVSNYISPYYHGISATTVAKDLETAFQLIYLTFCDYGFDEAELAQTMGMIRPALGSIEAQPQWQFQKKAIRTLYADSLRHPLLSAEMLEKVTLQNMSNAYGKLFNDAAGLTVAIVGDFNEDDIKPLVEKYIGSIPKGKKPLKWGNKDDLIRKGTIENDFNVKMETPKVTVSQVYSMNAGYSAKREVTFDALSYILDMIYTSTLREEEGGTYGAQVMAKVDHEPASQTLLEVDFETNPESADKLRELARAGLKGIASDGPTADHFDKAVKNLQKKVPENRVKNLYWMNCLENWYKYKFDYITEYEGAIDNLKPEDIKAAARELLDSGNFIELVMRPE